MEIIRSKDNKFIKTIKKLKTKKGRDKEGHFIAEGRKFLDYKEMPRDIIISEEFLGVYNIPSLLEEKVKVVSTSVFKELSTQEASQGIILIYPKFKFKENYEKKIVILDRLQDPGNIGTIIRIIDSVGFKTVFLMEGTGDIYNPKTVRSSMGSIFNLNFKKLSFEELKEFNEKERYKIHATGLTNESVDYLSMKLDGKDIFVFGNEGNGVSQEILDMANEIVKIPIYGSAESLNVGVATGIVLYKVREIMCD